MGTDDTSSKRKTDPAFQTMPPGLRPFVVPGPKNTIEPGENPRLDAAMAGLHALDELAEVERRAAQEAGSVKQHVAPALIPQAAKPASDRPAARVEISVPVLEGAAPRKLPPREKKPWAELPEGKPILESQALVIDEDLLAEQDAEWARERAQADARKAPGATTPAKDVPAGQVAASPWGKEAGPAESLRASALPSSLRPRDVPAPESEKPAAAPAGQRRKPAALLTIVLVLTVVAIGVRVLMTRRTPENGPQVPAPKATMTSAVPTERTVTPPELPPSAVPEPPPASSSVAPAAPPSATPVPERQRPAPRLSSTSEDPYADAAVKPIPAVTAAPVAPPMPPSATLAPPTPPAAPAPTAKPSSTGDIF